jgi:hypothetical protein
MNNSWIELKNGDAFELIKQIPDKSIDLVFTDPPYDQTEYMPGLPDEKKKKSVKNFIEF